MYIAYPEAFLFFLELCFLFASITRDGLQVAFWFLKKLGNIALDGLIFELASLGFMTCWP